MYFDKRITIYDTETLMTDFSGIFSICCSITVNAAWKFLGHTLYWQGITTPPPFSSIWGQGGKLGNGSPHSSENKQCVCRGLVCLFTTCLHVHCH